MTVSDELRIVCNLVKVVKTPLLLQCLPICPGYRSCAVEAQGIRLEHLMKCLLFEGQGIHSGAGTKGYHGIPCGYPRHTKDLPNSKPFIRYRRLCCIAGCISLLGHWIQSITRIIYCSIL